jgi:hypothetical protein
MLYPPIDPNERFRERRAAARRRRRLRRAALSGTLLLGLSLLAVGAQFVSRGEGPSPSPQPPAPAQVSGAAPRPLPVEIRGVHVTMGLASLPGKLDEYLDLEREGQTALQLDVKDENGEVGFVASSLPLQRAIGASRDYYEPRAVAKKVHERGLYLIGRVVVFADPILSRARPALAIRRADGSVWRDAAGLGWTNPYDRRVWKYNVDVAVAAARSGFDEIMFDYVRFPSDGDVEGAVYRVEGMRKHEAIPAFLRYASRRLEPLGVRISAAVFGVSAMRDLGIGQIPERIAPHVHALYPMTYPSHFRRGELGLADPDAAPGATVARALERFRKAVAGTDTLLVPWVQDFSLRSRYGPDEVRAQIYAARVGGAKGYLLWNARGVYSEGMLAPP